MEEPTVSDNRLTSERIKTFQDALELLYIRNNLSGRLHFAQEWPAPAKYIFGDELGVMDRDGTHDRARRSELEKDAEQRRLALLDTVMTLEKKSADRGIMNMEYVRDTVMNYGRSTSLLLYASRVVDKFLPPAEGEKTEEEQPQHTGAYVIPEPEVTIEELPQPLQLSPLDLAPEERKMERESVDPMDAIQPISVGTPVQSGPQEAMAPKNDLPAPAISPPTVTAPQQNDFEEDKGLFAPNAFERVEEPAPEDSVGRPKLKIFGIKEDKNDGSGNQ